MKLRVRSLERHIRRSIRQEMAQSPALRHEKKRSKRRSVTITSAAPGFWIVTAFAVGNLLVTGNVTPVWALFSLSLLVTGASLFSAGLLPNRLSQSHETYVFSHFPVVDTRFFTHQWWRIVSPASPMILTALLVLAFSAGFSLSTYQWIWTAILGLSQWLIYIALLALAVRWLPAAPCVLSGTGVFVAGACLLIFSSRLMPILAIPQSALMLTPSGWVGLFFVDTVLGGNPMGWLPLIAMLAVLLAGRSAYRFLRASFLLGEALFAEHITAESIRDSLARQLPNPQSGSSLDLAGAADSQWHSSGFIERLAHRILRPRERTCADFLTAQMPNWTALWKRGIVFSALGTAILAFSHILPIPEFMGFVLLGIGTATALPVMGGAWPGLRAHIPGTTIQAMAAFYPLGYCELTLTMLKINALRLASWILPGALLAGFLAWRFPCTGTQSPFFYAGAVAALTAVSLPFVISMRLMGITSALGIVTLRSTVFLLLLVIAGLPLIAAWIAPFLPAPIWLTGCAIGVAAIVSLLFCWLTGVMYRHWFDLTLSNRGS